LSKNLDLMTLRLNGTRINHVFAREILRNIPHSRETAINLQSNTTFADANLMKNSSLRYFFNRVHLAHFYVGVRKLMFEWQACSHRILIAHINRISETIDLEDKALMRENAIGRDPIFHERPHQSPRDPYARKAFPTVKSLS